MWYKGKIWSHGFRGCNFVSCIQHVFFSSFELQRLSRIQSQPPKAKHAVELVSFYFLSKVLEVESTSHLRIASGISHVSPAPSALFHWWVPAFSLTVTGSYAVIATTTYKEATYSPFSLTVLPPITAFQEPPVFTEEGNADGKNAVSQVVFMMRDQIRFSYRRDCSAQNSSFDTDAYYD